MKLIFEFFFLICAIVLTLLANGEPSYALKMAAFALVFYAAALKCGGAFKPPVVVLIEQVRKKRAKKK